MSHFSDIGFTVEKQEDIGQMFLDFKDKAVKQQFNGYIQYLTNDASGAQLYWYTRKASFLKKEEFLGVTPAFNGVTIQNIREPKLMPNKEWPLEPSLDIWIYDDKNNEYPLIVDLPNYLEIKEMNLSEVKQVQATLFVHSFEYFSSEEDFRRKYPKDEKISIPAPGMFIPTGTFSSNNDPNFKPHSECWCYGRIKKFEKFCNTLTDKEFYHFTMTTLAADYDVVVDISMLESVPRSDGIIGGTFWICAKAIFS